MLSLASTPEMTILTIIQLIHMIITIILIIQLIQLIMNFIINISIIHNRRWMAAQPQEKKA